jgi:hypothetical protein
MPRGRALSTSTLTVVLALIVVAFGVYGLNARRGYASGRPSDLAEVSQVRNADGFPGTDACAKIAAAISANGGGGMIDARAFTGMQPCATNMFSNVTAAVHIIFGQVTLQITVPQALPSVEGIWISGQSRRAGLDSGGTLWKWTGDTNREAILDASNTSNFQLSDIHIADPGAKCSYGVKLGGVKPTYWDRLSNVYINGMQHGIGILLGNATPNVPSDVTIDYVQVSDVGICMQGAFQDIFIYNLDCMHANTAGLVLEGNSSFSQWGGHYGGNAFDIRAYGDSGRWNFDGVWFENSKRGILSVPRPITPTGPINFNNCHLSTSATSGYMLDTTNINGVVNFIGNTIVQQGSVSVTTIYLASTLTDSVRLGNTGARWVGADVPMH